jgi:CubicO group peptidase (beta-lactamase class C family)
MDEFSTRFSRTAQAIETGMERQLHVGAQLYVSLRGQVLADAGIGLAGPGVEMTPQTVMPWLSAGKPVAAVALAQLHERGKFDWDDLVMKYLPEFGVKGKEAVTIGHLLTHTGGFRWADFNATMPWEEIISRICAAPLEPRWIVGETAGYHAFTSWYILGEIVRRLDDQHRSYDLYARQEIFLPLGMGDCWFSFSPEKFAEYGDRMGVIQTTGKSHALPIRLDDPERCGWCSPGSSARGPMRQLGKLYEMLLNGGRSESGLAIVSSPSVAELTTRSRIGKFDLTFKHIVDWGLGFIVNSAKYGKASVPYGFGPHAAPKTFGHGGSQSSVGMGDPEHGLVIALVFNGMAGEAVHQIRMRSTLAAIYEDLQLGESSGTEAGGIA